MDPITFVLGAAFIGIMAKIGSKAGEEVEKKLPPETAKKIEEMHEPIESAVKAAIKISQF